jgi:O-antigen/teichoic acid export membrane protein
VTRLTARHNPNESLSTRVVRGSAWLFSSYGLSKAGRMAMMLVVAALLSPREYGIIGLCAVIATAAQIVNEFGIWQAVVHRSELEERFLNTAFTANILGGFLIIGGLFVAAPWIADFYGQLEMTNMLRVMGIAFLLDSIYYVPDGLLRKELRFKSRALPEVAGSLGAGVTTIALLLLGGGVLSYAVGFVAESATRCILTFRQVSWRPRLQISRSCLREITSYGKYILGTSLAKNVSSNMDYLIVGRVLGAGPLGFYALAFNLANYPVTNFAQILTRIVFPTFATLQGNPTYAKRVYLKVVRLITALVAPALVMLALLAAPLIVGLLGEKWQPAILPLQVMVVAGISRTFSFPSADFLRAFGFPKLPFRVSIAEALVISVTLLLVASRGIDAVALTVAVVLSLSSWTTVTISCYVFGVKLREMVGAFVPGATLAGFAAGAILSLRLLDLSFLPDSLELAVSVVAAGAAIVVCLVTVCRSFLREVVALAASGRSK